jgi:hypothetical protein
MWNIISLDGYFEGNENWDDRGRNGSLLNKSNKNF